MLKANTDINTSTSTSASISTSTSTSTSADNKTANGNGNTAGEALDYGWCKLKPVISAEQIKKRVQEIGKEISDEYGNNKGGLVVVGLLDGCFLFMADIIRQLNIKEGVSTAFVKVSSYKGTTRTSNLKVVRDLEEGVVEGKTVLLVDDILDTGYTMEALSEYIYAKGAKKVITTVALDKACCREAEITVDYAGFVVDDFFVVGYGLDYKSMFRELGSIYELVDLKDKLI